MISVEEHDDQPKVVARTRPNATKKRKGVEQWIRK
jgi:hypothetical protein